MEFLRKHLDGAASMGSDPAGLPPGSGGGATRDAARPEHGVRPAGSDPGNTGAVRADGAIRVIVGAGADDREQWIVPGSGRTVWFKDHPQGPEMVVVPANEFMMGSPANEPERESGFIGKETYHRVTIAEPFTVSRCTVTRGEFAAFVQATGHKMTDAWRSPGYSQDDTHPVVYINWDDAKTYTNWLANVTGKPYRLPSEAEWEYVARADKPTPFWWGSSITPAQANYDGNFVYAGGGSKGAYRKATLPGAYAGESFQPNPWGLHQVHGNVWEWCEDCWNETLPPSPADGSALIIGDCDRRVVRGGSWSSDPGKARAAVRLRDGRRNRVNDSDFRVVR